jgi:recombination protein RecR
MSKLLYPSAFEELIASFRTLPGIGSKSAERMAYQILEMDEEAVSRFASSLLKVKNEIKHCQICGLMSDTDTCNICNSNIRDESLVCVVQNSKDVFALEKSEGYNGLYHVLNGVISTVNGKSVDELNLDSLVERVNEGKIKEVILATNPTVEGEVTALYISELLKDKEVIVTRLAYGLPVGAHLDYADELTLNRALQGRRKISNK